MVWGRGGCGHLWGTLEQGVEGAGVAAAGGERSAESCKVRRKGFEEPMVREAVKSTDFWGRGRSRAGGLDEVGGSMRGTNGVLERQRPALPSSREVSVFTHLRMCEKQVAPVSQSFPRDGG